MAKIENYERQIWKLLNELNLENSKSEYLMKAINEKEKENQQLKDDIKKLHKTYERNTEQEKILLKDHEFLFKMINFVQNKINKKNI